MKRKSKILIITIPFLFLIVTALIGFLVTRFEKQGTNLFSLGKEIGVIRVRGVITRSAALIKQIHRFRDDRRIGGVILRINSPGGGVVPSQEIYEELRKLNRAKPVVTSMGSVCASGGYYIAAASRVIFANPGTVTGSIGVIVEFSNLSDLFKKIGVKTYVVKSGPYKDLGYPTRKMNPKDLKVIQTVIDSIYNQFVVTVSQSRHIPVAKVRSLADGRVFSGIQAQRLGLVDRIGNLQDAITYLGKRLGVRGKPHVIYARQSKARLWDLLFKSAFGKWIRPLMETAAPNPFYYLWSVGTGF